MPDEPNTTPTPTPSSPASPAGGPASSVAEPPPAVTDPSPAVDPISTTTPPSQSPKTEYKPFTPPNDLWPKPEESKKDSSPTEPVVAPPVSAATQPDLDALLSIDSTKTHGGSAAHTPPEPPPAPPAETKKKKGKGIPKIMLLVVLLLGLSLPALYLGAQKYSEIRSRAASTGGVPDGNSSGCCSNDGQCQQWFGAVSTCTNGNGACASGKQCKGGGCGETCSQSDCHKWICNNTVECNAGCTSPCGDGICGQGESVSSCSKDCKPDPTATPLPANYCDNSASTARNCRGKPNGTVITGSCTCAFTSGRVCGCIPLGEVIPTKKCGSLCCWDLGYGYPDVNCDPACGANRGVACAVGGESWLAAPANCVNAHACGYVASGPECGSLAGGKTCQSLGYGTGVTCNASGKCVGLNGRYFTGCGGPDNCYNCYAGSSVAGSNGCFPEAYSCGAKTICHASPTQPPITSPPPTNPPAATNTPTTQPTRTPTPTPRCGSACTTTTSGGSNCPSTLVCENSKCILPVCKTTPSSCDSTLCRVLPTPTNTPTPTTVAGQCQNIKIYKDGVVVTDLSTLKINDNIVIAVVGSSTTQKAHIRVNGGTFTEITEKNSNNEYTYNFQIPRSGQFTVEAEVYIGGTWR